MIKKSITFENFNGETVTEEFYFHLGRRELMQMQIATPGGIETKLAELVAKDDKFAINLWLQDFIGAAYGIRSPDGKEFTHTDELTEKFMRSPAFDVLFSQVSSDEAFALEFIKGLVPKDLAAAVVVAEESGELQRTILTAGQQPIRSLTVPATSENPDDNEPGLAEVSGLKNPFMRNGTEVLPWWNREPTTQELATMNKAQLLDVMNRKNSGWTPPQ